MCRGGESKRPRAGNAFAHVPRNVPRKAAAQQVTLVAWGCGHVQLATLSPGPHFRLRCSGLVCVAAALWLALLDGMTEAGRCSDGAEQPPLAPSIKGGAADVLCLAAPRVRRHSPPPLLILVQAGQISPTPVCDTRDAAGPGGGEAIHTAAMWVMYPSYGCPDQPPEIRDRSRCAVLVQRQDATERQDVQSAPVHTKTNCVGCLNLSLEGIHSR